MPERISETDELQTSIERLSSLLETLLVRGLRACGPDELAQLRSCTEFLEQAGAGHVAATLSRLHEQIEKDDPASTTTLLMAQSAVRLLGRLLTLRVVRARYEAALAANGDVGAGADEEGIDQP